MNDLNILLPGIIWNEIGDYKYLYRELDVPCLSKLLSRAKRAKHQLSYSDFVYSGFTEESLAMHYVDKLGATGYQSYLIAEPTHLRADRDRLLIAESELLQLNENEAYSTIQLINQHFAGDIYIWYIREDLWLLGCNIDVGDLVSYPIIDIVGENADEYLPTGKSRLKLHALMNEIQMLLHECELNKLRTQEGLIPLNSLWLWDKPNIQLPCLIDRGVDSAYYPLQYRDSYAWLGKIREIEQNLISPLLLDLASGKYREINIWIPHMNVTWCFTISKYAMHKFWSNRTLEQIAEYCLTN